jgi:gas vesicle protein
MKSFITFKKFFMASKFLVGFTLGIAAGLLLAPDKGSESRKKLSKAARDLKDKFDDFVDNVSDKYHTYKNEARDMASEARSEARNYASDVNSGNTWGTQH